MNRRRHFARFLTFEDAAPSERAAWQSSFIWFMRKVTYASRRQPHPPESRSGSGLYAERRTGPEDESASHGALPLLIKSPVHTARVAALLEIFPEARFIFIHRDPLEVRLYSHCYTLSDVIAH